jgi:5-hydroxyisourate hydrolase
MSGGRLTTHVLDTATGQPAAGLPLTLLRIEGDEARVLAHFHTNHDGRCDAPLLSGEELVAGIYEIVFRVGAWRAAAGAPTIGFYHDIPIRFRVDDPNGHYHVPLILSPFGYSTYRGS